MFSILPNATQPEDGQTPTPERLNYHKDRCGGEGEVEVCALGSAGAQLCPPPPPKGPCLQQVNMT